MLWQEKPPLHLSYCLNIHKGEKWEEVLAAVKGHACRVRDAVAPDRPFGLGLRLGAEAVSDAGATGRLEEFQSLLREENLYVFSVNGFPYGRFHETVVKEEVYRPDWTTSDRLNYTKDLARIMAALVPEGSEGCISTVPVSYKAWMNRDDDIDEAVQNLAALAGFLGELEEGSGREIHLGLEPEPDCFLETTDETIAFFEEKLFAAGARFLEETSRWQGAKVEEILRRHIGICFDTCHLALQFEDLADAWRKLTGAGIRLSKVQVSNALEIEATPDGWGALSRFAEPVYLHQVKARKSDGTLVAWPDLPEALASEGKEELATIRVHFHVPLFFERDGSLGSTGHCLSDRFLSLLRKGDCAHVEIETYAYDVLPEGLRSETVEQSITREFQWLMERAGFPPGT